jgi:hypothetical protein
MPERTTEVTVHINTTRQAVDQLIEVAEKLGSRDAHAEEPAYDERRVGNVLLRATFGSPDLAQTFCGRAETHGGQACRRLATAAITSWIGHFGRVESVGGAGGSISRIGQIEQLDDVRIRITPRGNIGGLDLGASTFGTAVAGDVAFNDIIDITSARPGDNF